MNKLDYLKKLRAMTDEELLAETKDVIEMSVTEFLDESCISHLMREYCEHECRMRDSDIYDQAEDYIHRAFTVF